MLEVLEVMVVVSITSEKVAEILSLIEIEVAASVGEVEETVGAVLSSLKAYDSKAGMVAEIPRLL